MTETTTGISKGVELEIRKITEHSTEKVKVIYNLVLSKERYQLAEEPCHHRRFANKKTHVLIGIRRPA